MAEPIPQKRPCAVEEEEEQSERKITALSSTSDIMRGRIGGGESASERKREMERRRRDLVSQRFNELEEQLQRGNLGAEWSYGLLSSGSVNNVEGKGKTAAKRIDKESVLKEARRKLQRQEREILELRARLKDTTAEIDVLRQEKLEMRKDKEHYRFEVVYLREEVTRLRADNFALWQVAKESIGGSKIKEPCQRRVEDGSGAQKAAEQQSFEKLPPDALEMVNGRSAERMNHDSFLNSEHQGEQGSIGNSGSHHSMHLFGPATEDLREALSCLSNGGFDSHASIKDSDIARCM